MPPAKKRRVLSDEAAVSKGAIIPNDDTHHPPPNERAVDVLYEQHKSTLQSLLADIASLTSLATSPSSPSSAPQPNQQELLTSTLRSLATLKFLTRQICLQTTQNHTESSWDKRKQVEEVSLMLENLNYEKGYLRGEIELCRGWNGGELAKLASEEMGVEYQKGGRPGDSMNYGNRDPCDVNVHGSGDIDEIIDFYLFDSNKNADTTETSATSSPVDTTQKTSHRNPQNHAIILQKLQKDLTTRSNLVQQLSESKLKLSQLQKRKEELNGHLKQIPSKLRQLEKAGEELSRFFGKGAAVAGFGEEDPISIDDKGDEDVTMEEKEDQEWKKIQEANLLVHQPSTATRMERFQLAQSKLPSPLYVLYVQLVGYLDAWSSLELLRQEPGSRSGKRDTYEKHDPLGGFVGAAGMDVVAVSPTNNKDEERNTKNWNVLLSLTPSEMIPSELSTFSPPKLGRKAKIEIVFSFDAGRGVVLASVEDKCEISDQGLLDELFPGDDGLVSPNASLGMLKKDEGDDDAQTCEGRDAELENQQGEPKEKGTQRQGKPYYWCQILAGLSFPAPKSSLNTYEISTIEADNDAEKTTFQIQVCTKAVLRQILRRIRARRTLKILLDALGKKSQMHPLPIHPSMKGSVTAGFKNSNGNVFSSSSPPVVKAKLVSWVEDCKYAKHPSTTPLTTRYIATIKRKSSTLKAIVLIETENYPCVPPVWTLQYEDGTRGSYSSWGENHGSISSLQSPDMNSNTSNTSAPPLFDAVLHRIECHVNNDLEKFLRPDVETTFDWILIHQLADIISCWDEAMSVSEKSGSGSNGGNSSRAKNGEDGGVGGCPRRWRKGKDRQLVGFGDKSPFFLYRNGL